LAQRRDGEREQQETQAAKPGLVRDGLDGIDAQLIGKKPHEEQ